MKNFDSLFAAYMLVWGILFVYHLTVGARVTKLQQEIERLKDLLNSSRPPQAVNR